MANQTDHKWGAFYNADCDHTLEIKLWINPSLILSKTRQVNRKIVEKLCAPLGKAAPLADPWRSGVGPAPRASRGMHSPLSPLARRPVPSPRASPSPERLVSRAVPSVVVGRLCARAVCVATCGAGGAKRARAVRVHRRPIRRRRPFDWAAVAGRNMALASSVSLYYSIVQRAARHYLEDYCHTG